MVGDEPIEPVDADAPLRVARIEIEPEPVVPEVRPVAGKASEAQLGDAARLAQLEHPIAPQPSDERVAAVHDAAVHGEPIAEAIERAHVASPTDRAQQLGGAAASAASGQGIPSERIDADDAGPPLDIDPLSRVQPLRNDTHRPRDGG